MSAIVTSGEQSTGAIRNILQKEKGANGNVFLIMKAHTKRRGGVWG
jgi:hypothetical protein